MKFGKLINGNLQFAPSMLRIGNKDHYRPSNELYLSQGYLPIVETPYPYNGKQYRAEYQNQGNKIVLVWVEIAESKNQQIEELKQKLADTDYKIIKCYEYTLVGQPLPYDVQKLHTERQSARNKIEQLEKTISAGDDTLSPGM
jgi:hypothetical protein